MHCASVQKSSDTLTLELKDSSPMSKIDHAIVRSDYAVDLQAHGDTAFKMWEYSGNGVTWIPCEGAPAWCDDTFYRHRRIVVEAPRCEVFPLKAGTPYWVPAYKEISERTWIGSSKDFELLNRGVVHLTPLRAREARAARLAIHR